MKRRRKQEGARAGAEIVRGFLRHTPTEVLVEELGRCYLESLRLFADERERGERLQRRPLADRIARLGHWCDGCRPRDYAAWMGEALAKLGPAAMGYECTALLSKIATQDDAPDFLRAFSLPLSLNPIEHIVAVLERELA